MFATRLKKEVTVFFVIVCLTSVLLVTYFTPNVAASPVTINPVSPSDGYVGDSRQIIGTIDTVSGAYRILFDGKLVANGTASPQKTVNATILIPHCYKGNHLVTLQDVNGTSASTNFTVNTKYSTKAIMPPQQTQLMEGQSTTIRVNVTGGEENNLPKANITVRLPYPLNNTVYYSSVQLVNTTHIGEYIADSTYPRDFGIGAHTNYTGIYKIASNITSETASFTVGLTNATNYHRFDTVAIQGANYTQPESVWISIKLAETLVFSKNVTASEGIVNANWIIPWNATYGTYNITLTSPGISKPIRDTQIFTISPATFQCQIQTRNLDHENVEGVIVAAYNKTTGEVVTFNSSDKLGVAWLSLETYTYSFKAFLSVKDTYIQIGNISALNITGDLSYPLVCQLVSIKLSIKDDAGKLLPFITTDLKYNYTQIDSDTKTLETNSTGSVTFRNVLANMSYMIEAKRYGYIFNRTSIGPLTAQTEINIACPTYTLFVHVVDSKEYPLRNVYVNVTEWSSELLVGNSVTNEWASISLNLTFGKYKVKVYDYNADLGFLVVLNETIVDLTTDMLFKAIHCRMVNLSPLPSALVIDYLGQPISNAVIEIERFSEIGQKWVKVSSQTTDLNGVASLPNIGGDYSISVSVSGQLCSVRSVYIGETCVLIFKIDKYITIGGLVVETNQLAVSIALGLLIIAIGMILAYKKILQKITKGQRKSEKKTPKN